MQLRIKTLYRENMTTLINILWSIEILAAIAIGTVITYLIKGNHLMNFLSLELLNLVLI